ncbi:MAG: solute:sodium symporter family transporter [Chitinophagales bacterium]
MELNTLDLVCFVGFIVLVIVVSLYAGRKEDNSQDYFLAGRKLSWWLIGLSLIASNISSEHFVGMSGKGYSLGLAIASYEWMAAITLILVALFFLPRFLKIGIYTIPEYLEYRYNRTARTIMAVFMMVFYVMVTLATVLYSGALALYSIFDFPIVKGVWLIGVISGLYTAYGGLKAVVWSDLIQGTTLMIGGLVVLFLGFEAVGGWESFVANSEDKLHTVLPWDHPEMPWVAVFIGGLWLPNIFYWGLNQFITQRTLGAKSIDEGQKGILFGATLKLLIPFIVVFPGIMAYQLYADQIEIADAAYPVLLKNLLPSGLFGVMFAALFGAVLSTMDSLLNSAAAIFTLDIYKTYINPEAKNRNIVRTGRIVTLVLVLAACLWAPVIGDFGSLYDYIQKFWGLIQPGIVAAFVFGILWKKVSPPAAIGGMLLNIPVYAGCLIMDEFLPAGEKIAFLHYMAITFVIISLYIIIVSSIWPNTKTIVMPERKEHLNFKTSLFVKVWSVLVFLATLTLYVIFY